MIEGERPAPCMLGEIMRLFASQLLTTLIAPSSVGWSAKAAQVATERTNALVCLYLAQNQNCSWGPSSGFQVAATNGGIEALLNAGITQGATYAAVALVAKAEPVSTDGLARQFDTLYHAGKDTTPQIAQQNAAANNGSAWGALRGQGADVADTALALTAQLDASSGYSSNSVVTALCNAILPGQNAGGGWGYLPKPGSPGTLAGLASPAILPAA